MNLNTVHLIGRVTRDPEVRALPSGTTVAKFGLATNHTFKGKDGNKNETTQFHNCVVFARLAEIVAQYVKKGQEIYVRGRVEYRTWEKKDGGKGNSTEIMVEDLQMGQKARFGGGDGQGEGEGASVQLDAEMTATEGTDKADDEPINPDDIPF